MPGAEFVESYEPLVPRRAVVVPRARRAGSTACLPIDQLIAPVLRSHRSGVVYLVALAGGGKTTALCHLRAVLPPELKVGLFDEPRYGHWREAAREVPVVVATRTAPAVPGLGAFELTPWTPDDCLEYAAATHRDRCASVLKRLLENRAFAMLDGSPQLLRIAIDRLVADESLADASDALRRALWDLLPPGTARDAVAAMCLRRFTIGGAVVEELLATRLSAGATRVMRHRAAQLVLSGEAVATKLCDRVVPDVLHHMPSDELLYELASAVRLRPAAVERLEKIFISRDAKAKPATASLLLAVNPAWIPDSAHKQRLEKARLRGARWARLDLYGAYLNGADLSNSDLCLADLSFAHAGDARFNAAHLRGANLSGGNFTHAAFVRADLSSCRADTAEFGMADFEGAKLRLARLKTAILTAANFKSADLTDADLSAAQLGNIEVDGADFSGANLSGARLERVCMRDAIWTHACFAGALMDRCGLEALELPEADFSDADLTGCDLTATRIPGANLRRAKLMQAGLAEVNWEGADLRDADFRHASFHLGSSRSGLVGSTIPCEGSKTGFYTDEFGEQDYKPPEEIRKANLRGADLRGARVDDCDFYLVDLRGARYTPEQADHFARCGAILRSRVA